MTGGTLVTMDGSGHMPNLRDPVRFNLILRRFIEVVSG
jgi:pimeloyl-ACP methyl ester carboxylesterase